MSYPQKSKGIDQFHDRFILYACIDEGYLRNVKRSIQPRDAMMTAARTPVANATVVY